ncbi:MAG: DnaD domain protein [Finegoldia magna]|uniref:DnaD domain protein n=1 Tax=Finegoldia magna TaxID=1260 RepID=UPI00290E44F3|nr:DnaD domain protein [Finegoldia magna]MDU5272010.1 DnaD domain protein [Finegoldia magna]
MAYGWISIHRKIQDDWVWNDKPFSRGQAWIDLIMMVNHDDNTIIFDGNPKTITRGSCITSIQKLCDRWGWSNTKVKKFLKNLQEDEKILLKIAPRKATAITIVNYDKYQGEDISKNITETQQKHNRNTTETQQKHINNNVNNVNNNNNGVDQSELNLDDPKLAELIKLYENCGFGLISPYSANMLRDYMEMYSFQWVKEAIQIAEQNNIRTLAYINGILKKKKAGTNKPKNSYWKKQTYYRPKQENELSEESRNLNNKIISNFMEKTKKEEVNTNAIAMQRMQEEFKKMRENNEKI